MLALILALAFAQSSGSAAPGSPTVLFVCEHGAVKSVVAAAHFNRLAAARGLPFRAVSRGTAPDASVPPSVADGLKEEGLAVPAGFSPTAVGSSDLTGAARVVTFDIALPAGPTTTIERWDGLPAFSDGYGRASAAILARVTALVRDLEAAYRR